MCSLFKSKLFSQTNVASITTSLILQSGRDLARSLWLWKLNCMQTRDKFGGNANCLYLLICKCVVFTLMLLYCKL